MKFIMLGYVFEVSIYKAPTKNKVIRKMIEFHLPKYWTDGSGSLKIGRIKALRNHLSKDHVLHLVMGTEYYNEDTSFIGLAEAKYIVELLWPNG